MTIFKFGLYAVGLYLEPTVLQSLKGGKKLSVMQAVQTVLDNQYEWSLRIVPLRNGSMGHLRDALVRRLKSASGSNDMSGTINQFAYIFPNVPLVKNEQVLFAWSKSEGLVVQRNELRLGGLAEPWTCQQLLKIYTDPASSSVPQVDDRFILTITFKLLFSLCMNSRIALSNSDSLNDLIQEIKCFSISFSLLLLIFFCYSA